MFFMAVFYNPAPENSGAFFEEENKMDMDFSMFEQMMQNAKTEEGLCARFYDRSVKTDAVDAHGFPVFKEVCFCEIRIKDNNSEVFDQPASEEKKKRFPVEYARYQLAKKQVEKGTPLEQFAFLTASEIESLKSRGIFTVEALAALAEEKAAALGIARERELAAKFMAQAAGNKALADWQKAEEKYKARIKKLEDEVAALRAAVKKGENE